MLAISFSSFFGFESFISAVLVDEMALRALERISSSRVAPPPIEMEGSFHGFVLHQVSILAR